MSKQLSYDPFWPSFPNGSKHTFYFAALA